MPRCQRCGCPLSRRAYFDGRADLWWCPVCDNVTPLPTKESAKRVTVKLTDEDGTDYEQGWTRQPKDTDPGTRPQT